MVGPALLRSQWQDVAAAIGRTIEYWSTERLSRGSLPSTAPSFVIVDEAHRFRNASTRRVHTLAPFLMGRRTLLLTATPLVNRVEELVTLLRLCLPEDALRQDGLTTLGEVGACPDAPLALRRVVIRSPREQGGPSSMRVGALPISVDEVERGARAVRLVDQLTARHRAGSARLLATVLLDAAASSDAALLQALRRYRALLLQACDAGGGDRETLRRFAGAELDQLVWWDLVGVSDAPITLPLRDLPLVEGVVESFVPQDSSWLAALRRLLTEGPPVVCFTRHRATARLLRTTIGEGTAWLTGDAAGIGPHPMPRESVLAAFGPSRAEWTLRRTVPRCLVATDVAAEGLNLQGAGRLVHIDLPWTATRIAQREGRLLRIGQCHREVEVLVREPPAPIEAALQRARAVARKGSLAARWLGRLEWSAASAAPLPTWVPCARAAIAEGAPPRDLVLIRTTDHATGRWGRMALERVAHGAWHVTHARWVEDGRFGVEWLGEEQETPAVEEIIESAIRSALRKLRGAAGWAPPRLMTRIHRLARAAAWQRDEDAVRRLDATLRWCHAAPTLGQRLLVERLAAASDSDLVRFHAPAVRSAGPISTQVIGVILFRSADAALRSAHAELSDHSL